MPELNGDQLGLYANREGEAMGGGAPFLPAQGVGEKVTRTRRGPLTLPTYDPQPGSDAPPAVAKRPAEGATETVNIAPDKRPFKGTGAPTRAPQTEREARIRIAQEKGERIRQAGAQMQKMAESTMFRGQPGLPGLVEAGALPPATLDLYKSAQLSAYTSGMRNQTEIEYPKAELERKIQDRNAARSAAWAEQRKGIVMSGLSNLAKLGGAPRVKSDAERALTVPIGSTFPVATFQDNSPAHGPEHNIVQILGRQHHAGVAPSAEDQSVLDEAKAARPERFALLQERVKSNSTYQPAQAEERDEDGNVTKEAVPELTSVTPARKYFEQGPAGTPVTPGVGGGNRADMNTRAAQQSGVFKASEVLGTMVGHHLRAMPEFHEALATGNSMKLGNFIIHMDMSKDDVDALPQSGERSVQQVDPRQQMADEGYQNEFESRVADSRAKLEEKNAMLTSLQQKTSADLASAGGSIGDVNWSPKAPELSAQEREAARPENVAARAKHQEAWDAIHTAAGHECDACTRSVRLEVPRQRWEGRTPSNTTLTIDTNNKQAGGILRQRSVERMARLWATDPDFYHHLLGEPGVGQHIEENQNMPWAKAGLSKLRRNVLTTKTPAPLIPFKAATATTFSRNRKGGKGKVIKAGSKGNLYPVQTEADTIAGRDKPQA
jgi:hypothetical protein